MAKSALITGVTGQDGAYLARFLLEKGYRVFGIYRRLSTPNFWRLQALGIFDLIHLIPADLIDSASLAEAVGTAQPDEIYHLAAQSFVGTSFEQPLGAVQITGASVTRMLDIVRRLGSGIKFYQASTSELYGGGNQEIQNENTPFAPSSPYAAAKLYGHWMTKVYRDGYGIFACNGLLFNHESPLRGLEFVTRKISNAAAKIALGIAKDLKLGNIGAKRDWGYAPEYVEAMWLMLQQDKADDYVIATGETHSVEEFAKAAFAVVDLEWEKYVSTDAGLLRPLDVSSLRGDYSKAKQKLGWKPKVKFNQLVEIMVKEDLQRWQRCQRGEWFPWDAPLYPNESKIKARTLQLER